MNERIVEIAQEVFSFKYKTAPHELNPGHHMDHIHLFAELLIKECCEIADEVERADTGMFVSKYIRAHFGVER